MDPTYWNEGFLMAMATHQQPSAATSSILRSGKGALRTVRKLERPRPLKLPSDISKQQSLDVGGGGNRTSDDVLLDIEMVVKHINNGNFDPNISVAIVQICNVLRTQGIQLETKFKDQLDRYFIAMRNACREEKLDTACRLRLLEIIELRAMGWRSNENLTGYYKRKVIEADQSGETATNQSATSSAANPSVPVAMAAPLNQNSMFFPTGVPTVMPVQTVSALSPGEVLKTSGKFAKPTKIPGKNYFKDEVIIRNSDSGKVMGIKGRRVHMIEEFSDTVISFQRVSQGAKDRLVQITGANEENLVRAKHLIEDTIRRNASPVRDRPEKGLYVSDSCSSLNSSNSDEGGVVANHAALQSMIRNKGTLVHSLSMNDATIGEYQYTVTVGRDTLKISGSTLELVKTAKLVLEEYFAGDAERSKHDAVNTRTDGYTQNVFIATNSRRSLQDVEIAEENDRSYDDGVGIRQTPSASDFNSFAECNGYPLTGSVSRRRRDSSSSSDSEDETYKDGVFIDGTCGIAQEYLPLDSPTTPALSSPGVMTIVRQPLFPGSPQEAFNAAEASPNFQAFSAKVRRARFAKTTESMKENPTSPTPPATSSPSSPSFKQFSTAYPSDPTGKNDSGTRRSSLTRHLVYSRDFLLDCAISPYSRVTPKDMPHIIREAPYLLKKNPELFDPVAYKKQEVGNHYNFPIMRSASTSVQDAYDDDVG